MTTLSSSTIISMAATANLRSLGAELNGWLGTAGLGQTADTGQVNWSTVTLPGNSTIIGYEVWRFADSSIYFKLEWFTAGVATTQSPRFWLTVGTGSDGAGGITGQTFARTEIQNTNAGITSTTTAYPTLICRTADFFGIVWKFSHSGTVPSALAFAIEKTVDTAGAVTSKGFCVSWMGSSASAAQNKAAVRTAATAASYTASSSFCAVPGNVTSSVDESGNKQSYLHAFPIPTVLLSNYLFSYVKSEAAFSTTVQSTLVGATQHTYIALENGMGTGNSASASANWGIMMLWE